MIRIHHRSVPWKRLVPCSVMLLILSGVAAGCDDPSPSPNLASNTNWLVACDTDAQCGTAFSCNCGACSKGCSTNDDCGALPGTSCIARTEDATAALCGSAEQWAGQGACLPRCTAGECGEAQFCAVGICVPLALPESQFCAEVANADSDARVNEEILASAVEQLRAAGVDCGNGSKTLPPLRLDPSLVCAARVLARDMAATGNHHLTDSYGRNTETRLAEAGYEQTVWAEGFAWDVTDAARALGLILEDSAFCTGFGDVTMTDFGVGYSGGVFVLTVAAQ